MPRLFPSSYRRKRSLRNIAFAIHQDPSGRLKHTLPGVP